MDKILGELVSRLTHTYKDRLKSVILYGSAAAGDYQGKFSDLNVLCVLASVTPRELAESTPIVRWWRDQGNPSPLMLTEEEVRDGTDCFPIEFHDIAEHRRVLYGADVADRLNIDDSFYRAQVEHELRAKLLRLRQKAAGILDDNAQLRLLLVDSLSTFCVLFRHALRLHGVEAKFGKRDVIAQARERFGIDPAPFEQVLEIREGRVNPRHVDPVSLLSNYMRQIGVVTEAVDTLAK
jgi:predicted nucleotidyltransferase